MLNSVKQYAMESNNPNKGNEQPKIAYTLRQLKSMKIESVPFLVDNMILQTGVCFLTGPSDTGKSTIAKQLAYSIISGSEQFLGRKLTTRTKRVLIVTTEDGIMNVAASVLKQTYDKLTEEMEDRLIFIFEALSDPKKLEPYIGEQGVDLIIVDAWADTFSGDLNTAVHVRQNLQRYKAIADKHQCLILGIHHVRKGSEDQGPNKNQVLGSQAIESYSRVMLDLRMDKDELRRLTITKGNDIPPEVKKQPLMLKLNEDRIFELSDSPPSGYGVPKLRGYDWELFKPYLLKYVEQSLSLDKMAEALQNEFPRMDTPKRGAIGNWLRENGNNAQ